MRHRLQALCLFLLVGCSVGTTPGQAPSSPSPQAPEQAASNPRPPEIPRQYDNVHADPMPTGTIEPPVPFVGDEAVVQAAGLPADSAFEVWLVPTHHVFRFGLPHPSQAGGAKLGDARSDGEGRFTFTFRLEEDHPTNNGTERGKLGVWLVYPDGKTLAPAFVSWEAGIPTTFQGAVFDEAGRPAPVGTRVRIKVTVDSLAGETTYFEDEMPVKDGYYRFDRVPAPASTVIEVMLPSGITRQRGDGHGGMQLKWGCCGGSDFLEKYGTPLTYNFGGPATPEDPWAPAFFLSERLADPAFAWTQVSGHVYDQLGNPVPDAAKAIVIVSAVELPSHEPFHVKVPVRGGTYSARVPIGLVSFDLRVEPGVHVLIHPRPNEILLPEAVTGHPNVVNFGGPATAEDPRAPEFAFPSPQPAFTGPSPFVPG